MDMLKPEKQLNVPCAHKQWTKKSSINTAAVKIILEFVFVLKRIFLLQYKETVQLHILIHINTNLSSLTKLTKEICKCANHTIHCDGTFG